MKFLSIIAIYLFFSHSIQSQITFSKSIPFQTPTTDDVRQIIEFDGYYYTYISATYYNTPNGSDFGYKLAKLDANGELIWVEELFDFDNYFTTGTESPLTILADSTLLLSTQKSTDGESYPIILFNYSLDGELLWTKTVEEEHRNLLWTTYQLSDGDIISHGWERDGVNAQQLTLYRFDSDFNIK